MRFTGTPARLYVEHMEWTRFPIPVEYPANFPQVPPGKCLGSDSPDTPQASLSSNRLPGNKHTVSCAFIISPVVEAPAEASAGADSHAPAVCPLYHPRRRNENRYVVHTFNMRDRRRHLNPMNASVKMATLFPIYTVLRGGPVMDACAHQGPVARESLQLQRTRGRQCQKLWRIDWTERFARHYSVHEHCRCRNGAPPECDLP